MKPTIGRIVHYYPQANDATRYGCTIGEPIAAVITAVHSDECVNLRVFMDSESTPHITSVALAGSCGEFSWSWPPRE